MILIDALPPTTTTAGASDAARLEALRATGLLYSAREESFDRLTRLAAKVFNGSASVVTLVDTDRQFFKSSCGLPEPFASARETPLSHSFCQHVVKGGVPFVVEDAREDDRVRTNGAIADLGVVAYLGVPLRSSDGRHVLGSFAVIDVVPRVWTQGDIALLTDLCGSVMTEIELRTSLRAKGEAEARLERAVRGSRDGLWEWNLVTNALYISPQSKAILGCSDAQCFDTTEAWASRIHPDDVSAGQQNLQSFVDDCERLPPPGRGTPSKLAMASDTSDGEAPCSCEYHDEYRVRHEDGTYRWLLVRAICFRDGAGRVIRLSGSHTDITERKQSEIEADTQTKALRAQAEALMRQARELGATRDEALSSVRAKGQFLANMSHEIRTPMNGIIGIAGLLAETPLMGEQVEYAHTIRTSAEALLAIINDILDLSKIEGGELILEDAPFVLRAVLENVCSLLLPRISEKGLELACSVAPSLPPVLHGDAGRLRQVLLNLIGNAIKFTEMGFVEVAVSPLPAWAGDSADTLRMRFSITDTGIGIPPERHEAIFHSFMQADPSTTRRYGGTGLGLTISRQLAALMGTNIEVVSAPGVGSTFTMDLSLRVETDSDLAAIALASEAVTPASDVSEAQVEMLLAGKRVLVADDVPANRRILREQLMAWGARVDEADGGMRALSLLQSGGTRRSSAQGYALALLDREMPGGDGRTTARLIREDPRLADIPLILLSSGFDMREGAPGTNADALFAAVLSKPVRQSDLLAGLLTALKPQNDARITASVRVPAPSVAVPETAPPMNTDRELLRNVRVLIAEDNAVNQKVALALLAKWGCEAPVAVENGRLALERVLESANTTQAFDVVLMDVQMPEMDGLTATERIRAAEDAHNWKQVPIIALTAHAMTGDRERCIASGMSDYVAKPVRPDALRAALRKSLGANGVGDASAPRPRTGERDVVVLRESRLRDSCGDDAEVMAEVITEFRDGMPALLSRIEASAFSRDGAAARFAAHTLKGGSLTVGAEAFALFCERLETAAGSGEWATVEALLGAARGEWARLDVELVRFLR